MYTDYLKAEGIRHPRKSFFEEFMNPTPRPEELDLDPSRISKIANETEIALITIGRNAGEGRDRKVENDFELSAAEKTLIKNVSEAFHAQQKKVVVILNIGGVIETDSWSRQVDAILLTWQPGLEAGNAVADVLSGKVNPSGKLTASFPVSYEDVPSAKNFPGIEYPEKASTGLLGMPQVPADVTHEEGIYVGYRYYNSFNVKTAYPFGYGQSYTKFGYSNLKLSSKTFNNKLIVTVDITNRGNIAGKEVVQLYISAPVTKIDKPAVELKGFAKTKLLKPGETQTLRFVLTADELASYNTQAIAWVADAGQYTVKIGASSTDIKLSGSFDLGKNIVTQKCRQVLAPQVLIHEMHR